jgi:Ni,Fe-hydrogenase III component G
VARGEEVPSISRVFFSALLIENEMKELFGLNVTDIVIDFGGHLLLTPEDLHHPMAKAVAELKGGAPA